MTETETPMPCPFCSGPVDYVGKPGAGYRIQCKHCGAQSGWGDYGCQVLARWNRRTGADAVKRIAMLEADLKEWKADNLAKATELNALAEKLRKASAGQTGGPGDPAPTEWRGSITVGHFAQQAAEQLARHIDMMAAAFLKRTTLKPEQCELVQESHTNGRITWRFRARADDGLEVDQLRADLAIANRKAVDAETEIAKLRAGMGKLQSAMRQVTEEKREVECCSNDWKAECLAVQKRNNALADQIRTALGHLAGAPCGTCCGTGKVHHQVRGGLLCSECAGTGLRSAPVDVLNARNALRASPAPLPPAHWRAGDGRSTLRDGEREAQQPPPAANCAHAAPCAPAAAPTTEDRLRLLERHVSLLLADRLSPPSTIGETGTVAKPRR